MEPLNELWDYEVAVIPIIDGSLELGYILVAVILITNGTFKRVMRLRGYYYINHKWNP